MKKVKIAKKVTKKKSSVGRKKKSKNGRWKKVVIVDGSSTGLIPAAELEAGKVAEYVQALRRDVDRARGDALHAIEGVTTLRAELDQHKKRAAKDDVDYERFAKEAVMRLDKLEAALELITELADAKSPAEEAGEFSSEFEGALADAAASNEPVLRGEKWRHKALSWTESKDGNFEEWAASKIEELWNAMKERIRWESDANHELRAINQKVREEVRENVLRPPDGCEIVVRRTS